MQTKTQILMDSLRAKLRASSKASRLPTLTPHWAEPVVQEVKVEREAMRRVERALDQLLKHHPHQASETHLRVEAARQAMRATAAMSNQQRMLFNDLPQPFHWA